MKPCPFCGGTDIRWSAEGSRGHRFLCMKCHAVGPLGGPLKGKDGRETTKLRTEDALRRWNKRAYEAKFDAEFQAMTVEMRKANIGRVMEACGDDCKLRAALTKGET